MCIKSFIIIIKKEKEFGKAKAFATKIQLISGLSNQDS